MTIPVSDIQFLAQMILKVRATDQITQEETQRLNTLAEKGHSPSAIVEREPGEAPQA